MRDVAKTSPRKFGRVETCDDFVGERGGVARGREEGRQERRPVAGRPAQDLEPIVVEAQREGAGLVARRAPRKQTRQAEMDVTASERIDKKMPALARLQRLDSSVSGSAEPTIWPALRAWAAPLRARDCRSAPLARSREGFDHGVGERGRKGHTSAGPDGRCTPALGGLDERGPRLEADEFKDLAAEPEALTGAHAERQSPPRPRRALRHAASAPYCTTTDASLTIAPMLRRWR